MSSTKHNNGRQYNQDEEPKLFDPGYTADRFMIVDLKKQYPVLNDMPELKTLRMTVLNFVYKYACISSEYVLNGMSDELRAKKCAEECFMTSRGKLRNDMTSTEYEEYCNPNKFSEEVKQAVGRMARFDPRVRYMAQVAIEESIRNVVAAMSKTKEEIEEMNMDDRKKYVSVVQSASQLLPDLIEQREKSFGYKVTTATIEEEKEYSRVDKFLQSHN